MHVVVDNYATHKHAAVQACLAKNKRVTLHFPDTGLLSQPRRGLLLIITRQAIRRGALTSVPDLIAGIRRYMDDSNNRCQPFTWTKTNDEILLNPTGGRRTSITGH
jgi:hypothetical protein